MNKLLGEHLKLRKWQLTDISQLVQGLNHPSMAIRYGTDYPYTDENARIYIEDAIVNNKDKFAIILKEKNLVIGGCGLHYANGKISGNLWITEEYQHRGLGTEAAILLVKYCFEKYDINQMDNYFFKGNDASRRMQEKIGSHVLEESESNTGDSRMKAILKKEDFLACVNDKNNR